MGNWNLGYDSFQVGLPRIAPIDLADRQAELWEQGWDAAQKDAWSLEDEAVLKSLT